MIFGGRNVSGLPNKSAVILNTLDGQTDIIEDTQMEGIFTGIQFGTQIQKRFAIINKNTMIKYNDKSKNTKLLDIAQQ